MDTSIPAALFEVWKFRGGYDHYFTRFLANDFELNKRVDYFVPREHVVQIKEITAYRGPTEGLSEKEEFHFDVDAQEIRGHPEGKFRIPYLARVELNGQDEEIILTQWTPLQNVPVERIKAGTIIEVWEVSDDYTMMKVVKL